MIRYKEDQWSPINQSGVKHYDPEFLIFLQNNPACKTKPKNLPNLEVILSDDVDINQRMRRLASKRGPLNKREPLSKRNSNSTIIAIQEEEDNTIKSYDYDSVKIREEALKIREESISAREKLIKVRERHVLKREELVADREESVTYREETVAEREKYTVSQEKILNAFEQSLKLRENNLKTSKQPDIIIDKDCDTITKEVAQIDEPKIAPDPMQFVSSTSEADDNDGEEIYRTVRQILDNLTSENIDESVKQVKSLDIKDEKHMKHVVNMIFERISDESSSEKYSYFCKELAHVEEPRNTGTSNFQDLPVAQDSENLHKDFETTCEEEVELHESSNPWKPARFGSSTPTPDDDRADDETCRIVRRILNKLTVKNFDKSVTELKSLHISNLEYLQRIVYLVYERAIAEPFSPLIYAHLCRQLADIRVLENEEANFKELMISECQSGIEKMLLDLNIRKNMVEEILDCLHFEQKLELQAKLEKYDNDNRMKFISFIKFIGGLFKNDMLSEEIILDCVIPLLENSEEVSLECLCVLLTITGKILEVDKSRNLQGLFNTIKEIIKNDQHQIGNRIKFMLEDLIRLRNVTCDAWQKELDPVIMKRILKKENAKVLEEQKNVVMSLPTEAPIPLFDSKAHDLRNKIKNIFEDMTAMDFDEIKHQICLLEIDNEEHVQLLVDSIYETAIENSVYTNILILLCKELTFMQIIRARLNFSECRIFRKILINKVQKEFESRGKNHLRSLKLIEIIGKMYQKEIVNSRIIYRCIVSLLKENNDNNLECLCVLLALVGKHLEFDNKQNLQIIFAKLQSIIDENCDKINPKIRSKIQDVIHLRKPKWSS